METLNIVEHLKGKFGPQVKSDTGVFFSFSKFYKGTTELEPGQYLADVYRTEKGNAYINSLEKVNQLPQLTGSSPVKGMGHRQSDGKIKNIVPTSVTKVSSPPDVSSSPDWDKISRGKVKSLFVQALLSNPNVVSGGVVMTEELNSMKALVNTLTDFVFESGK